MTIPNGWLSCITAVLLLSLGCGGGDTPEKFQASFQGDGTDSFDAFKARVTGTDPLTLHACSTDPTPEIEDDGRRLCLLLSLDAARLSSAGSSATLPIQGEARLPTSTSAEPPSFTGTGGHAPAVTAAWTTVSCFAPSLEGSFVQQLQGRLELTKNTATRLAGHVVLSATGQLSVNDCGRATSADFEFSFDVPRP